MKEKQKCDKIITNREARKNAKTSDYNVATP